MGQKTCGYHLDQIKLLLNEQGIHILALNETKIDQNYSNELLEIEKYKFMRLDRNRNGGGVGIYCRNSMQCVQHNDIPSSDLEIIWIEITYLALFNNFTIARKSGSILFTYC